MSDEASARLDQLFVEPPRDPGSEPYKDFPLRRGFVIGKTVYTLTTDVNGFMPELEKLVEGLEKELKN